MKKRNINILKEIGPKFKEYRQDLNISLNEVSNKTEIISVSTLSRWERGEETLSVETFEKLIASLNISYSEIIRNEIEAKDLLLKIEYLYQENKIDELKKLVLALLKQFNQEYDKYLHLELLFKTAIAANFYLDLTGVDLTDAVFKSELIAQVLEIKYWFKKEILLFGNVQFLLDTETIYVLARSLASKMYEETLVSLDVSIALVNAGFVLIKKKAPMKAMKIMNVIKKLHFSRNNILVKIRLKYMEVLLSYITNSNKDDVYRYLKTVKDDALREDFEFVFGQIQKIYK